jgi:hypothetical protein
LTRGHRPPQPRAKTVELAIWQIRHNGITTNTPGGLTPEHAQHHSKSTEGAMEIRLVAILAVAMLVAIGTRQFSLPYTVGLVIVGAALSVSKINVGAVLTRDFISGGCCHLCY